MGAIERIQSKLRGEIWVWNVAACFSCTTYTSIYTYNFCFKQQTWYNESTEHFCIYYLGIKCLYVLHNMCTARVTQKPNQCQKQITLSWIYIYLYNVKQILICTHTHTHTYLPNIAWLPNCHRLKPQAQPTHTYSRNVELIKRLFPHTYTHTRTFILFASLCFFFTTSSWSSPKPFGTFDSISTAMTIASKARSRFACMHMCMVVYLLHAPKSMPQLLINWKQLMANKVRTSRQIQTKIGQSAFMHAFMEVRRHNGIYQAHIYTHTCVSVRNLSFCVQKHNVLAHMYTH